MAIIGQDHHDQTEHPKVYTLEGPINFQVGEGRILSIFSIP